jgi:hypothetical protein
MSFEYFNYSCYEIFATYVKHLQDICKYFIWNVCTPLTSGNQILNGKLLIVFREQSISLDTCVTIETHTVHFTLYVLHQHQSQLLLHYTHCDSVSTFMHAKNTIMSCCILLTHTCKSRRLGVKNTITNFESLTWSYGMLISRKLAFPTMSGLFGIQVAFLTIQNTPRKANHALSLS